MTIGEWAQRCWDDLVAGRAADAEEALRALGRVGVRIELSPDPPPGGQERRAWIMVANNHKGLAGLFDGTHWAAKAGASSVWSQSLRRLPKAHRTGAKWFAGVTAKATAVPADVAFPEGRRSRPTISHDNTGQGDVL